jgi:hypothetical protein
MAEIGAKYHTLVHSDENSIGDAAYLGAAGAHSGGGLLKKTCQAYSPVSYNSDHSPRV